MASLSHDLADCSGEGFPLLFLTFLPVVLPEVIVGGEHGELGDLEGDCNGHADNVEVVGDAEDVLRSVDLAS